MSEQAANDERFRALVSATSDVVYRLSADWEVMYELDGRGFLKNNAEPISGWRDINVHPLDREMVDAAIAHAIAGKTIFSLEHRVNKADGSTGWTFSRAVPILNDKGKILEWFGVASDISYRKETEAVVLAAKNEAVRLQQVYEMVTSNTPDLVYVFELDYTFSFVNQALLEMLGKSWEESVGKGLLENGYEPWHAEMHQREIDHIVATGERVRGEVAFPHAVLGKRIYDYILTPVFDSSGKVVAVSGVTRDVTDRKLVELEKQQLSDNLAAINEEMAATNEELTASNEALVGTRDMLGGALERLSRSETKLRYLISNAPVAIALLSGRGLIIETANAKVLEIWGKDESIVGKPLVEAIPELIGQGFLELLDEVFISGVPYIGKEQYAVLEGKGWYLNFFYQPITGEDGLVDSLLITATDVTELVQSRHRVEEAEIAMRLAIEAANFGTWWIHSETREFVTSDRLKELFGFLPTDKVEIGDAIAQILPAYQAYVSEKLEAAITAGGNYDVTYPTIGFRDQKIRWLRAIGNLKEDPSGGFSAFTGVVMDITEAYLATKNIERAEESLRLAIDAAELGSFQISITDRTFIASPRLKQFFGYLADDVVPYEAAIEQIHEEYRDSVAAKVEDAIVNGTRFDTEYPVIGYRDGKVRWVRAIGTVQKHNNGVDSYFTGVLHEITERKMDEMRKNDFIGMVSHELKTPLTSLNGYLQLMERTAKKVENQFLINTSASALKQVKKMSGMINGFLNISRLESGKIFLEKTSFDFNSLILESVEDIRDLESSANISYVPHQSLPVFADYDKLGSVISNFLSNAIKYAPAESEISVSCELAGEMAKVSVSDHGLGIREKDLEKVFERFYRVEDNVNVSGFGIGLYLSAEIVRRHGGKIWAESQYGKGSTFCFQIPISA